MTPYEVSSCFPSSAQKRRSAEAQKRRSAEAQKRRSAEDGKKKKTDRMERDTVGTVRKEGREEGLTLNKNKIYWKTPY